MGKQMTEMLKGTLEGIVLRSCPSARVRLRDHGWLREQGFSDIAEGTVYALLVRIEQRGLVDVEKIPSEKGPPRKVYSLNAQGREYLESSGGRGASSQNGSNSSTKEGNDHGRISDITGCSSDKRRRQYKARTRHSPNLPHRRRGAGALPHVLRGRRTAIG